MCSSCWEGPKDFNEIAMTTLKWEPKATKCSNNLTVNQMAHAAKTVARIHRRSSNNGTR